MDFEIDHAAPGAPLPDLEILELWNASFGPEFQLSEALWLQNTTLDPSFNPADIILARDETGKLAGFAQAKANAAAQGGANAVVQAYHGSLVPPFCNVAARAFFQQVLASGG